MEQVTSNTLGFLVANVFSFCMNAFVTFRAKITFEKLLKYSLVITSGLLFSNLIIIFAGMANIAFHWNLFATVMIISTYHYILHKHYTFK